MKTISRRALSVLSLAAALVAAGGCAEKNIQVSASSDSRTAFDDPVERPGVSMGGAALDGASSRPPFISLSSYDWDYGKWLEDLTGAVGSLRLPDSKEAAVELVFRAGRERPDIVIECADLAPADCERLRTEVEDLRGLPELPKHETMKKLKVTLSRLP